MRRICDFLQYDISLFYEDRPVYQIKPKHEKKLFIALASNPGLNDIITSLRVSLELKSKLISCRKTKNCQYTTNILSHLKRHEQKCTDEQLTVDQQVKYGIDVTPIKKLFEMGYLPEEALEFRKTFFTCYDCETLEDKTGISDLKNVEAIHRVVSIAVSTNRGHSRCFVRKNSTHEAAVEMFDDFLKFLDEINADHDDEIPQYFHEAIERLELMSSDCSTLPKRDKMELQNLKKQLSKYILHDIFGFNSGKI